MILALLTSDEAIPVLLVVCAIGFTLLFLALIQQAFLIDPVVKRLQQLHKERVKLVREALDSESGMEWSVSPVSIKYPFDAWVQLTPAGVLVAGQTFSPDANFTVVARDTRNLPRAAVSGNGQGMVTIQSHGQTYQAKMVSGNWEIQLTGVHEP